MNTIEPEISKEIIIQKEKVKKPKRAYTKWKKKQEMEDKIIYTSMVVFLILFILYNLLF